MNFVSESQILAKELSVSDALIHFLMNSDFEGNVGNIKILSSMLAETHISTRRVSKQFKLNYWICL